MRLRVLDSIRGLLIVQMVLDHFGKPISTYLYQCFGYFSAAEGFFFLSGFVGAYAAISKQHKDPTAYWMRQRAFSIWQFHLFSLFILLVLSILIFPELSIYFKANINRPFLASLFSILLIHTPAWLDVLPLYVFLMLIGSFVFPVLLRGKVFLVFTLSLCLWLMGQWGGSDFFRSFFPPWVYHGFFDIFSWQLLYFSGACIAVWYKTKNTISAQTLNWIGLVSILISIFFFLWSRNWIALQVPNNFWIDREHLGVIRYLNFMFFMSGIAFVVRNAPYLLDFKPMATIGKQSLWVYSTHTIMIYLWFISPASFRFYLPWNVFIPILACVTLWFLAVFLEYLKRPHSKHDSRT